MAVENLASNSMANISWLHGLLWWRNWGKREWAISAIGFAVFVFALAFVSYSWNSDPDSNLSSSFHRITATDLVDLTLLHNATRTGAVCLDGSLPGYHYQKGFGSGANSWVLYIEGGGWCNTIESCFWRREIHLGSSKHMGHRVHFTGILSPHQAQNPEFFNWNRVKVQYCDGASLAGHPDNELRNGTRLFFRGQLIWEALMDKFFSLGLSKAKQALLAGCSAGGLAALIRCDEFRGLLPKNGLRKSLHKDCIAREEPAECLFPKEIIKNIATPVFLLHSAYDFWQIQNILIPEGSDPYHYWQKCRLDIHNCNATQVEILKGYRRSLLKALKEFQKNKEGGMFISSCFIHCQAWMTETWHAPTSPRINNKTIAESVGDWYFNRNASKKIDCPFLCNPTCYHVNFTHG
ncbi:PREDICTED: pectin acetylesterase [Prunus dulcis]|uniref:Pectin acetylesterase n=1 Tax=Prunus dulcis TaxID=3755 RepID=A0A5E4F643_PRUDU|nr:pectin acetylesterase 5-like isoform X2 [Prunus dulcis]VVA22629.1 PREDICTED: pectin acetylesterase [Prunus dulcis]